MTITAVINAIPAHTRDAKGLNSLRVLYDRLHCHITLSDNLLDLMRKRRGVGLEFAINRIKAHTASAEKACALFTSACTILVNDASRLVTAIITIQRYQPPG